MSNTCEYLSISCPVALVAVSAKAISGGQQPVDARVVVDMCTQEQDSSKSLRRTGVQDKLP